MAQSMTLPDVLTIEETASYLRLPKETIEKEAVYGQIPGRRIKDTWRFLKVAIDNWLQGDNHGQKSEEKATRRQVSKEELAAAAQLMLADYTDDYELTAFTALDGEDFYAKGKKSHSKTRPSPPNPLSQLSRSGGGIFLDKKS